MIRHYYKTEIRNQIRRYWIYYLIAGAMFLLLIFG